MDATDLEFIEAKLAAYDAALGRADLQQMFAHTVLELNKTDGSKPRWSAKEIDRTIEQFVGSIGPKSHFDSVRQELRAKFGYERLGAKPDVVLKKVLKRGRIVSDIEAEAVRDFVANLSNEGVFGSKDFRRLAEILDEAGY